MPSLTVFYTANLRGDADTLTYLLPRLHTFIQKLRHEYLGGRGASRTPTGENSLLLDLGGSCALDVWPCSATGGRSTFLVLDAMGYDTANASALSAEDSQKLTEIVQVALVDASHQWERSGLVVACAPGAAESAVARLTIVLNPQENTHIDGNHLYLARVDHGQLGIVQVDLSGETVALQRCEICNLPPGMPPDATISGTAELVLSEARAFQRKQG